VDPELGADEMRSTVEVINDHLGHGKHGSVEEDLSRNYAEDVTVFIAEGLYHGHDGVLYLAERLRCELPAARFTYATVLVHGDVCFLVWTGEGDGARVRDASTRSSSATARSWPRPSTTPSNPPRTCDDRHQGA
jgi:hypothetical protein